MKFSISNNILSASFNSLGAELFSLKESISKHKYVWEGNSQFWEKHVPILFPIIGVLKNNSFFHNHKDFKMSRHGFARDEEFEIKNKTENNVKFALFSNKITKARFPFDFELLIKYQLSEITLETIFTIINTGNETLPFSIGGHPAFALQEEFEKYSLKFEKNETLKRYLLKDDLLSNEYEKIALKNKILPLTYSLF